MTPPSDAVLRACELLDGAYESPRHGNPTDPVDVLVYILLSNRTAPAVARRVYAELKRECSDWNALLAVDLRELLNPAGLAGKRAAHLRGIAEKIHRDYGSVTLEPLATRSDSEAEAYLCALPGVSVKVAKCILMYGFGRHVLPVDVHVHRITSRLGWHSHKRADQSHATLEALVPPDLRYAFHVNCLAHGRAVCRPRCAACDECFLSDQCLFFQNLSEPRRMVA